ncbi:MAG TPA: hydroxyacid dehydrogenase, partial [Alcanivorax sp.]|nr:hydroxyacid dehydrogenase [Alcanivorax sp.]
MSEIKAYGAQSADSGVHAMSIERRAPRPADVAIKIDYCGVCHTDIHFAENDWGRTLYPVVPGHEIIGRVTAVGDDVSGFKVGDVVGVGCMVDSCRHCAACEDGLEQYCVEGMTGTYNGRDRHDKSVTFGGYSESVVVSERFVVRVPE